MSKDEENGKPHPSPKAGKTPYKSGKPPWLPKLTQALRESLGNLSYSARAAGVSRQAVIYMMRRNKKVRRQVEAARDEGRGELMAHAKKWGTEGIRVPVYDEKGRVIGYQQNVSERILLNLLQNEYRRREKKREPKEGEGGEQTFTMQEVIQRVLGRTKS